MQKGQKLRQNGWVRSISWHIAGTANKKLSQYFPSPLVPDHIEDAIQINQSIGQISVEEEKIPACLSWQNLAREQYGGNIYNPHLPVSGGDMGWGLKEK